MIPAGLFGDLRSSLRSLRRRPVFAAGAIVALALGIGANLGLFTLVHAVLLRDLPYREADRLLWIWSTRTDRDRAYIGRVVALVDDQVLSRDLVLSVFQKARQRHPRVPLVPFRFMLAALAAEKGVEIPY